MKFRKSKKKNQLMVKKSINGKKNKNKKKIKLEELNWKRKKVEKCVKNELEIECFKYGGKVTLHLNVPKRK